MSIHANLTPEAQLLLRKQERKSRILSGIIACLSILLIAGLLAIFVIPMMIVDNPVTVTYAAESREESQLQEKKVVHQTQRKQAALAQNIAKVIDFSFSMRGKRERLMREELAQSVAELPPGMLYQLIFFSGPAWVAGDTMQRRGMTATVTSGKDKFEWRSRSNEYAWDVVNPKKVQTPAWVPTTQSNIDISLEHIKKTSLVGGTVWMPTMQMALRMDPAPQVIYFMTDGIVEGQDVVKLAKDIAELARSKGTVVNTIALMEPKARKAMITLAHETGGVAVLVDAKGERQVLEE